MGTRLHLSTDSVYFTIYLKCQISISIVSISFKCYFHALIFICLHKTKWPHSVIILIKFTIAIWNFHTVTYSPLFLRLCNTILIASDMDHCSKVIIHIKCLLQNIQLVRLNALLVKYLQNTCQNLISTLKQSDIYKLFKAKMLEIDTYI